MSNITLKSFVEWAGCVAGLIGAALLAVHTDYSGWGFVFFLMSNACMLTFGIITKSKGIILMQIGFTLTSLLGIYNWIG